MISDVIFDLDGTLVDSFNGIEFSLKEAIAQVVPDDIFQISDLRQNMGLPIKQIIQGILPNLADAKIVEIEKKFRFVYDNEGWKKFKVFDTVEEMLSKLKQKNIRMFVLTNKPTRPTTSILKMTRINDYLTDSISSDHNYLPQKKDELLKVFVEKYDLKADKLLVVGDTIVDWKVANTFGCGFAYAAFGFGNKDDFEGKAILYRLYKPIDLITQLEGE